MSRDFFFTGDFVQTDPWPIYRHIFVVAEIGINHNGSLDLAKLLIDMAHRCGCDAVKFQKRSIDIVYPKEILDMPRESPWGLTQRDQKQGLEFGTEAYKVIDAYCAQKGMIWFASAWDIPSLELMRPFNLPFNKIASAMVTHLDFVEAVAAEGKPTFVSTGMCGYDDIDRAVNILKKRNCEFVLMHTVAEYPAPEESLNLRTIIELRRRYGCPVGYSGHESTVSPSVMAGMMGACAIERHITLDRAMYGSDQAASLEKAGLESLVAQLRKIPLVAGDGCKRTTPGEEAVARKLRYWL